MIKNKKAESLVGIIIAVFILSFTMLGILNIFGFNKGVELTYKDNVYAHLIKGNSENLIKKLDIPEMNNNDFFYIKKDKTTKTFSILTGTTNEEYQYIDYLGNKVDPNNNPGKTYKRVFQFKADILKHVIYPNEIPNMVFWYDANNINGTNNSGLNNGYKIGTIKDLSGNGNDAYQTDSGKKPELTESIIKDKWGIKFNGSSSNMKIYQDILINDDGDGYYNRDYREKTIAVVLKTGDDVTSDQVIFEQGGKATGYNFMIHEGDIYAGIHNKANAGAYSATDPTYHYEWDDGHKFKSVNLGEALPNTIYFITIVQDSSHFGETGNETIDDNNNKLKIYLNGELANETNHVDPQAEHYKVGLGAINYRNVEPWSPYNTINCTECNYFKGYLGELIEWNHALTDTEIRGLQNYFEQKWYDRIDNVKYNIIKTSSYKIVE